MKRLNESVGNEPIYENPDPMLDFLSTCTFEQAAAIQRKKNGCGLV